jgi:hypothetical protein
MDLDYLGGWSWFAIGAVEPTVHGQSLLSYKGWVDEFRIYSIEERHKELNFVGGVLWPNHFDEFTCNLALGTLRKYSPGDIRCEQLNLTPHDTPLEMGPQRSEGNLVCADRVHRNADPVSGNGCVRPTALRFSSHRADQARSDFSSNAFCVGCHSHGAMVPGLDLQALQPGAVERQCDPRRQPMDWPAVLTGLDPVGNGASLPANHCSGGTGGMLVDGWLEGTQNLLGNGRVTPIL